MVYVFLADGFEESEAIVPIDYMTYGNTTEVNALFKEKCKYFLEKQVPDIYADFDSFVKQFRRMLGELELDPDLEKDGMKIEPAVIEVKTSPDNMGDSKGTTTHKVGYFAFYNKDIFDKGPAPVLLAFHGGGDSAFYISYISGWAEIAHRHNFLLVAVEHHLQSSATEMIELVEHLKKVYNIDSTRIYASGFSMGGIKTWDIIQEYPNLVAAAAPMDATVDIGENVYFSKINKPVNTQTSVPIFYAAGEQTPLAEFPYQEQKCINRMAYALKLNGAKLADSLLHRGVPCACLAVSEAGRGRCPHDGAARLHSALHAARHMGHVHAHGRYYVWCRCRRDVAR